MLRCSTVDESYIGSNHKKVRILSSSYLLVIYKQLNTTSNAMTIKTVAKIISEITGGSADDVVPDAKLQDLGLDSLKAITVLYDLEEEYDIEIPNEIIESMKTVGDIVSKVDELRQQ